LNERFVRKVKSIKTINKIEGQVRCLTLLKTEHPYVEINPKKCNGSPVVKGTRIRIVEIAMEYEYFNHTPDDIINAHPHLKLEQIHDALSYYYENRASLDEKIRQDEQFIEEAAATQKGR